MLFAKALSKLRIAPLPTIISILTTLRNSIIKFPRKFCSQPSIDTRYLNKILEPKLSMFSTAQPCCLKANSRTSMMNNWNKKTNRIENKWTKEIDPKMWSLEESALISIMRWEMWGISIMKILQTSLKSMKTSSDNFWKIVEIPVKNWTKKSV